MSPLPLIFMGSPQVAVTVLEGLMKAGHEIRAVVTQPDKPAGRGQHLHPPPVKEFAVRHSLQVFQPVKMKDPSLFENLKALEPRAFIVAAYGKFIPNEILMIAPAGCLNVHFSLLLKYRGASCVASAIRNGEKETGVTIMRISEKLDAGPILKQKEVAIAPDETAGELEQRLGPLGTQLMIQVLEDLEKGKIQESKQDEARATYAPLIKKEEGRIDWSLPAQKIHNLIRAFNPWPAAFTHIDKTRLKVYGARLERSQESGVRSQEVGKITNLRPDGISVVCGEGRLLISEVQPESKRRMSAWEFAHGHQTLVKIGQRFE